MQLAFNYVQMDSTNRLVLVFASSLCTLVATSCPEILQWEAGNRFRSFYDSNYSGKMGSRIELRTSCADKLVLAVIRADPSLALSHRCWVAVFDDLSNGPLRRSG